MDCQGARESLLESLIEPLPAERLLAMETHIAECESCGRFAEVQRLLDVRIASALPVVSLSPGFRSSVRERIRLDAAAVWPEFLPDIAHLIGCAFAIVLSVMLLPQHSRTVVIFGSALTGVTYFVQAVLRSSLERMEAY